MGGNAPGNRAHQGVGRADAFQRRVGKDVDDDRRGGESGAEPVAGDREISDAGESKQTADDERVARQHAAGGNWPRLGALHERVEPALPPLIERGGAGRGQRSPEDGVEKREVIDGASGAQIKADRRGEQDQKRQARFDEFREIRTHAPVGSHLRWRSTQRLPEESRQSS